MPTLWRAPIPMVRIKAPQITGIQKLRRLDIAVLSCGSERRAAARTGQRIVLDEIDSNQLAQQPAQFRGSRAAEGGFEPRLRVGPAFERGFDALFAPPRQV